MASDRDVIPRGSPVESKLIRLAGLLLVGVQLYLIFRLRPALRALCVELEIPNCADHLQSPLPWVLLMASVSFAYLSFRRTLPTRWAILGLFVLIVATIAMRKTWPYFMDVPVPWG